MSDGTAIFVNGPEMGSVLQVRAALEHLHTMHLGPGVTAKVAGLGPDDFKGIGPVPLAEYRIAYRKAIRQPLPFGYVPYIVEGTDFTQEMARLAIRMIELLVESHQAKTTETLIRGYRETGLLMDRRIRSLEERLNAVIANHNLSTVVDEYVDDEEDE